MSEKDRKDHLDELTEEELDQAAGGGGGGVAPMDDPAEGRRLFSEPEEDRRLFSEPEGGGGG